MKWSRIPTLKLAFLLVFAVQAFGPATIACQQPDYRININMASTEELQTLPGIGPKLAARIAEHRQKHGFFKRPQDLIIVRGMSAKKFRPIAHLIVTRPAGARAVR
jgi:competence ComEA-like helix-hairpin-helix protein